MKRILRTAFVATALLAIPLLPAQPPAAANEQSQINAVITELQAQQAAIAANQAKIDAKLATLAETIRVAKIYSSRGGH